MWRPMNERAGNKVAARMEFQRSVYAFHFKSRLFKIIWTRIGGR